MQQLWMNLKLFQLSNGDFSPSLRIYKVCKPRMTKLGQGVEFIRIHNVERRHILFYSSPFNLHTFFFNVFYIFLYFAYFFISTSVFHLFLYFIYCWSFDPLLLCVMWHVSWQTPKTNVLSEYIRLKSTRAVATPHKYSSYGYH